MPFLPRVPIASSRIISCIIFFLTISRNSISHSPSRNEAVRWIFYLILPLYSASFSYHVIILFTQMSWHASMLEPSLKLLFIYPVIDDFVIRATVFYYTLTSTSIMELFDIYVEFPTWSLTMTFISFQTHSPSCTTSVCNILSPRTSLHYVLNSGVSITDHQSSVYQFSLPGNHSIFSWASMLCMPSFSCHLLDFLTCTYSSTGLNFCAWSPELPSQQKP